MLREFFLGILFKEHGTPFGTFHDFVHTGLEMIGMAAVGIILSYARTSHHESKKINKLFKVLVDQKTEEILLTQKTSIEALAILAEYNDTDTGDHLKRIQEFVRILTEELKNNSKYSDYLIAKENYVNEIMLASLLHDIGKVAIDQNILKKPGKLTEIEFESMKNHTTIAGEMLNRANNVFLDNFKKDSYLALARDIAYHHHEKWDGSGYPDGLMGEKIPLSGRIVAVADVYDALTSRRIYKEAWSHEDAVDEIKKGSGTHFDPEVVNSFLNVCDRFR